MTVTDGRGTPVASDSPGGGRRADVGSSVGSSLGSGAGAQTHTRIYRHQHAAEVLRARSIIAVACGLWLVVGGGLDVVAHHALGRGSLGFVLACRLATSAFHLAVLVTLFRRRLPSPRVATALTSSVFPVSAISLTLISTHMGGLTSPYVTAMFVIIMVEAIALPGPWQRGALLCGITTAIYPVGQLIASRFDDQLAAQLHDSNSVWVFATFTAVLFAAAIVSAWGGHIMWSLRQSVFESRKLGRYRLLKRIGQGGMGEVWRAQDRALRRDVALKILSPEHGRRPSRVARFEREIEATAAIAHPNVIRIHDWGVTDDGVWYYAMDLLDGDDLGSVIRRCGPMPPALALHLFAPAATGLAAAHKAGVIHRDVKPGNMFVVAPDREPARLELLDFGIAQVGDDAELTQAGAVMGTPGFIAPEVQAGAPGGVPADIYGFAAALFFAVTGTSPRDAQGEPASALDATIPAALDDELVRALDAEPSRRHASADELAAALAAIGPAWTGHWPIDRGREPATVEDPSIDHAAPTTHVDASRHDTTVSTPGTADTRTAATKSG